MSDNTPDYQQISLSLEWAIFKGFASSAAKRYFFLEVEPDSIISNLFLVFSP